MTISKEAKVRLVSIRIITLLTELGFGWDINKIALKNVQGIKEDKYGDTKDNGVDEGEGRED